MVLASVAIWHPSKSASLQHFGHYCNSTFLKRELQPLIPKHFLDVMYGGPQGEEKGAWHMEAMKEGYNTTAAAKHYVHAARHAAMKEREKERKAASRFSWDLLLCNGSGKYVGSIC